MRKESRVNGRKQRQSGPALPWGWSEHRSSLSSLLADPLGRFSD